MLGFGLVWHCTDFVHVFAGHCSFLSLDALLCPEDNVSCIYPIPLDALLCLEDTVSCIYPLPLDPILFLTPSSATIPETWKEELC